MIIRFRQFTFGVSHQFAMIPFQYEYRIIKPGLFTRLFKELTQSPIRILNEICISGSLVFGWKKGGITYGG